MEKEIKVGINEITNTGIIIMINDEQIAEYDWSNDEIGSTNYMDFVKKIAKENKATKIIWEGGDEDYLCKICKNVYNTNTETPEIKESGSRICPDCWNDTTNE